MIIFAKNIANNKNKTYMKQLLITFLAFTMSQTMSAKDVFVNTPKTTVM